MPINNIDMKVQKMFKFADERPLKAFVDVCINDCLLVKGIKVIEGKKGLFVSMPQEQGKDNRWYESVRPLNKDFRALISDVVLDAYHEEAH